MPAISDAVSALDRDLRAIFGGGFRSLVAYGVHAAEVRSKAATGASHASPGVPPTHTMVLVESITADALRACAGRAAEWHEAGLATPLFIAAPDLGTSLDVFPLEFSAILADHIVVSGPNPFEGLRVEPADVRRACEVQARSHLLHLREGYVETRERADALAVLIVRSAPAFAALLSSVARLQGVVTHDAAAAGRHAERTLNIPGGIITGVIALADVTEISSADAVGIFPAYLDAVERLVRYVDGWSAA